MPETCTNIKAVLEDLQGKGLSSTAKLVAILETCGITDRAEVEALLEVKSSTLREARSALKIQRQKSSAVAASARNPAPEIQRTAGIPALPPEFQRQNSSERQNSSVGTDLAIAHANKESPTEISITKIEDISLSETRVSDPRDEPAPKAKRRHSYTHAFEEFWKAYPDTTNNSKPEAFKQWRMLTSAEQVNATDGLRHLRAICQKQTDYRCVHACRYLSQRRWESYPSTADRLGVNVVPITGYKLNPVPRREVSQAELEAMVLADEAREAARV